jgi:hypothetical protein
MKEKIILIITLVFFLLGCDLVPKRYRIFIFNNSNQPIYVHAAYILPDTSLPVEEPQILTEVPVGTSREYFDVDVKDAEFKRFRNNGDTLTIFILSKTVVEKNEWSKIRTQNMVLKRYEVTYTDLSPDRGGTLYYPNKK